MKTIKFFILSILLVFITDSLIFSQNAEQILETNKPALVSIWNFEEASFNYNSEMYSFDTAVLWGSGFLVNDAGLVGTCYHVVSQLDSILIKTSAGKFYPASIVSVDTANDLALLKIANEDDKIFHSVKLGNSDDLKTGEPICVIGNPFGFEYTISQGIVSGIRDSTKEYLDDKEMLFERVIQTDAAVSPGNSGGAFFNLNGEVIGITSYFYLSLGNLNFGIPINIFKRLIDNSSSVSYIPRSKTKTEIEEKIEYYLEIANSLKEKIRLYELSNDPAFRTKQAKPSILPGDSSNTTININQDSLDNICLTKAEYFYNKCIGLDSAYFNTYDDLIDYYVRIKKPEMAEGLYEKAQMVFQNDHRLQFLSETLERFYVKNKNINKIKKLYGISDKFDQADPYLIYKLGLIYEINGDKQNAFKLYKMLIKKDSGNYRAYFQLGKYYYESGFYSKARKYLESSYEHRLSQEKTRDNHRTALLEDSYSDFDLHYYLGMISIKQNNKTAALINYIKLNPSSKEESEKLIKLYKKIVN